MVVRLLVVAIFFAALNAFASSESSRHNFKTADAKPMAGLSSQALLEQLYDDPIIYRAFKKAQAASLRTTTDLEVAQALTKNPLIQAAMPLLQAELAEIVSGAKTANLTSMTRLNPDIPAHKALLQIAQGAVRDIGMNSEQRSKMQFFVAMGPVNAYNQDFIVVVYDSLLESSQVLTVRSDGAGSYKLVKRYRRNALKGVITHELGHKESDHVLMGIMSMAMTVQLSKLFVSDDMLGGDDPDTFFNKLENGSPRGPYGEFWSMLLERMVPDTLDIQGHPIPKTSFVPAIRRASGLYSQISSSDPEQAKALFLTYLNAMAAITARSEMPARVGFALQTLTTMLMTAPDLESLKLISAKDFKANFGDLEDLVSREMEASADFYMYMGVPPEQAVAMHLKFGGADLEESPENWPAYLGEIRSYIKAVRQQVAEDYKITSIDDMNDAVGAAGHNHATSAIRVSYVLDNARTVDAIGMRNPFLRLVVTRNALMQQAQDAQSQFEAITKQLKALKDKLPPVLLNALQKAADESQEIARESTPKAEFMTKLIVERIKALAKNERNPRLDNLIDYQLARKNQVLRALEQAKAAVAQVQDQQTLLQLQAGVAALESYGARGDDLLAIIASTLVKANAGKKPTGRLARRLSVIKAMTAKDLTPEKIADLRSQLDLKDRTRIEDDPRFVSRTSNLRSKVVQDASKDTAGDQTDTATGGKVAKKKSPSQKSIEIFCNNALAL